MFTAGSCLIKLITRQWCETENPLWGRTNHPANPEFTPGGSTGGEGTLLALKGSVVGWGTDIGGSVRVPCHMLGLYGLKPSVSGIFPFLIPIRTALQNQPRSWASSVHVH
jgi:Asp-tRNA(Asn)/Glu-tRNA(Gln) amidotransferase A subunit family amidase